MQQAVSALRATRVSRSPRLTNDADLSADGAQEALVAAIVARKGRRIDSYGIDGVEKLPLIRRECNIGQRVATQVAVYNKNTRSATDRGP